MSLPSGWAKVSFDQIAFGTDYVANGSFASLKENVYQTDNPDYAILVRLKDYSKNWQGDYKYVTKSSYEFLSKSELIPGDLYLVNVGAPGKLFLVPDLKQPMTMGPNGIRVRAIQPISNEFLAYYYSSPQGSEQIQELVSGTAQQKFNKTGLRSSSVILPPLNEQKRIANKLDELLSTVESIKTRLDNAPTIIKRFRQSILAAATSGKLTEEWRENNPQADNASKLLLEEIEKVRKELLEKEASDGNSESKRLLSKITKHEFKMPAKELPKGWIWTSFMESMERVVDCHNKTAPYKESGIPLIRTTDIRNGLIKLERAKFIDQDTYDYWSRRCPPKEGDLIFTREAPMGEVGIVPENTTLCMGQRMMLLRPLHKYILNKYMLFNIMNPNFQQEMKGSALGATVQHLRVGDVEKLVFPLCPLEEQKEIVSQVESLFALADTLEEKIEAAKKRVDKLTQSILAKAFKGELVPQDPNDEPAEELLKHIKAEQEKEKPKPTKKKK